VISNRGQPGQPAGSFDSLIDWHTRIQIGDVQRENSAAPAGVRWNEKLDNCLGNGELLIESFLDRFRKHHFAFE
jgi:hypothetical protein